VTAQTSPSSDAPAGDRSGELKYWEDLAHAPRRRFGPLVVTSALLDHLLDLMGERHPIHDDASFASATQRPGRIVPGGFIHSITSGWTVRHGAPAAITGMRSMTWKFVRPLPLDTPFYFTTETEESHEIGERAGIVKIVRRVTNEAGDAYAIGRMDVVVLRRPEPQCSDGHVRVAQPREDTEHGQ
jgi:acyl dehydratase